MEDQREQSSQLNSAECIECRDKLIEFEYNILYDLAPRIRDSNSSSIYNTLLYKYLNDSSLPLPLPTPTLEEMARAVEKKKRELQEERKCV
jgi:hypothetical protein